MEFSEVIEVARTADVRSEGDFASLMISSPVLASMKNHGFLRPSPVQQRAIPAALSGLDILVQAKSGTGKTLVFSVLAVENVVQKRTVQRLIVAPTREIAVQIAQTIKKIAPRGVYVGVFTGGTAVGQDRETIKKGVQIAVGTSGRLVQLVHDEIMYLDSVDVFVLDEADQLMKESFFTDINYLFSALPSAKQVAVFSATYPRDLENTLARYMRSPCLIRLNSDDVQLIGIKQYALIRFGEPFALLAELMEIIVFKQALVFCNLADDCATVCERIRSAGLDAVYISSQMEQADRNAVIERLKSGAVKVLVSTDLTARGIDATNVNLVVNLEPAVSSDTYFHRIGRAARYGGYGAAVTILSEAKMCGRFRALVRDGGVRAKIIRESSTIPSDLPTNETFYESCESFVIDDSSNQRHGNWNIEGSLSEEHVVARLERVVIPDKPQYTPPPNEHGKIWAYDRELLLEIREHSGSVDDSTISHLDDLELSKTPSFSRQLEKVAADLKTIRLDRGNKENQLPGSPFAAEVSLEVPQQRLNVPSRLKGKKKFYLRGEMVRILESVSKEGWQKYAQANFDVTLEPFLPSSRTVVEIGPLSRTPVQNNRVPSYSKCINGYPGSLGCSLKADLSESMSGSTATDDLIERNFAENSVSVSDDVLRYSRKQVIAVTRQHSSEWWRTYVQSKWNTKEDPFVMDASMRCSFEEQLRRQRVRERNQRSKVLKERRRAVETGQKVVASARTASRRVVEDGSWGEYRERVQKAANIAVRETTKDEQGPVVAVRSSAVDYSNEVSQWTGWLKNMNRNFYYTCMLRRGSFCESSVCTGEEEAPFVEESQGYDPLQLMRQLKLRDERNREEKRISGCTEVSAMERMVDELVRTDVEDDETKNDVNDDGTGAPSTNVTSRCPQNSDSPGSQDVHDEEDGDNVIQGECLERPLAPTSHFSRAIMFNHYYSMVMSAYVNTSCGRPF